MIGCNRYTITNTCKHAGWPLIFRSTGSRDESAYMLRLTILVTIRIKKMGLGGWVKLVSAQTHDRIQNDQNRGSLHLATLT